METTDTPETTRDIVRIPSDTDHLDQVAPGQPGEEDGDEDFSDDPEVIFRREYSKLETIPLTQPAPWRVYVLFVLLFASFLGGAVIGLVTYPSVTVTLVPVAKQVTYTGPLAIPTRPLAPVTLTKTASAPTTGHGHQDATNATGILTFYNGAFVAKTVEAGTVLTGRDGTQVATNDTVTIPAGNPPSYGQARLTAHALRPGSQGNLRAGEINQALSSDLLVNNLTAFTGGSDARDFQAVAKPDLDTLTSTLQTALVQQIPQTFRLQLGESGTPTNCVFHTSADHSAGEEATTITMKATSTCKGIAYNSQELETGATAAFTSQTNPGVSYELLSTTPPQVVSVTPLTVRLSGTWVYVLSADYEQFLAEQIAGESQQDARAYLLRTGLITRATVPAPLPKDPGHIHFLLLIGGGEPTMRKENEHALV